MGFITNNAPTERAIALANLEYAEFALTIFNYFEPFFQILFEVIQENSYLSNNEIFDVILKKYNGREITFLTETTKKDNEKNTRYISSYLNILRDDYGVLDFKPRLKERKIIFNPFTSNKNAFLKHIQTHSQFKKYENCFRSLINEI